MDTVSLALVYLLFEIIDQISKYVLTRSHLNLVHFNLIGWLVYGI
jgi:hypothetical protein